MISLSVKILLTIIAIILAVVNVRKDFTKPEKGIKQRQLSPVGWIVIFLMVCSIAGTWYLGALADEQNRIQYLKQMKDNQILLDHHKDSITVAVTSHVLQGMGKQLQDNLTQIIDSTRSNILTITKRSIDSINLYRSSTLSRLNAIYDSTIFMTTEIQDMDVSVEIPVNSKRLGLFTGVHYWHGWWPDKVTFNDDTVQMRQNSFLARLLLPELTESPWSLPHSSPLYNFADSGGYRGTLDFYPTRPESARLVISVSDNPALRLILCVEHNGSNILGHIGIESDSVTQYLELTRRRYISDMSIFRTGETALFFDSDSTLRLILSIKKGDLQKVIANGAKLFGSTLFFSEPWGYYFRSGDEWQNTESFSRILDIGYRKHIQVTVGLPNTTRFRIDKYYGYAGVGWGSRNGITHRPFLLGSSASASNFAESYYSRIVLHESYEVTTPKDQGLGQPPEK